MRRGPVLAPVERQLLALMLGLFQHFRSEGWFVGNLAGMAVEVQPDPFRHGPANPPTAGEIVPAVASGNHRESMLSDESDEHAVGAAPEKGPGRIRGFDRRG